MSGADVASAVTVPAAQGSTKPAKVPKSVNLSGLKLNPPIISGYNGTKFFTCQYTLSQINKRAGVPELKNGVWRLRGAFYDFNVVAAYLADQCESGKLTDAEHTKLQGDLCTYLERTQAVEVPPMRQRHLKLFQQGQATIAEFTQSYQRMKIPNIKFRTPAQDEFDAELKKKSTPSTTTGMEVDPLKAKFAIYSDKTQVSGVRGIADLFSGGEKPGNVMGWHILAIPEQQRYAVQRFVPDREKDKALLETLGSGMTKLPHIAALPASKKAGRAPLLVAPRKALAAAAKTVATAGPQKRKASDAGVSSSAASSAGTGVSSSGSGAEPAKEKKKRAPKKPKVDESAASAVSIGGSGSSNSSTSAKVKKSKKDPAATTKPKKAVRAAGDKGTSADAAAPKKKVAKKPQPAKSAAAAPVVAAASAPAPAIQSKPKTPRPKKPTEGEKPKQPRQKKPAAATVAGVAAEGKIHKKRTSSGTVRPPKKDAAKPRTANTKKTKKQSSGDMPNLAAGGDVPSSSAGGVTDSNGSNGGN